jgi:hypothetical protein
VVALAEETLAHLLAIAVGLAVAPLVTPLLWVVLELPDKETKVVMAEVLAVEVPLVVVELALLETMVGVLAVLVELEPNGLMAVFMLVVGAAAQVTILGLAAQADQVSAAMVETSVLLVPTQQPTVVQAVVVLVLVALLQVAMVQTVW